MNLAEVSAELLRKAVAAVQAAGVVVVVGATVGADTAVDGGGCVAVDVVVVVEVEVVPDRLDPDSSTGVTSTVEFNFGTAIATGAGCETT